MHIQSSLKYWATYINGVGDDILKFNTYVKGLVHSLHGHIEHLSDMFISFIKGYFACKDK